LLSHWGFDVIQHDLIHYFAFFCNREILSKAENSRTGHTLTKPQIQQIEQSETKHEEELEKVRLRHISLKTLQKKLERTLRAREQLAEGLHMIDFEQLKIENQTLNEKIEERNEELAKLKRKKTTTIQVLTHIREKLRFVEQANRHLQEKVGGVEVVITDFRNTVTIEKLERDEIRTENKEWKAKQGFATSDLLLLDFEKQKQTTEELSAAITELKNRYEILVRQVNNVPNFNSLSNGNNSKPLLPPQSGSWGSLSKR
jgi:chromosome segregation ATPase